MVTWLSETLSGSYLHIKDVPSLCDAINTFSINFDFSQPGFRIDIYVFIPFYSIYIVVFFHIKQSLNIYSFNKLTSHSLAHILFILFIHGILIISCLTLVKKVFKSLYENLDTNIGENIEGKITWVIRAITLNIHMKKNPKQNKNKNKQTNKQKTKMSP